MASDGPTTANKDIVKLPPSAEMPLTSNDIEDVPQMLTDVEMPLLGQEIEMWLENSMQQPPKSNKHGAKKKKSHQVQTAGLSPLMSELLQSEIEKNKTQTELNKALLALTKVKSEKVQIKIEILKKQQADKSNINFV